MVIEALDNADNLFGGLTEYVKLVDLNFFFKPMENTEGDQSYELQML